jgi:hypothetical protein
MALDADFNEKENNHIAVLNAYIVCLQREPGDTTASKQQQCIQYADEELIPYVLDLHKQTLIYLQYFVQELQQGGDKVILFVDANQDEIIPSDRKNMMNFSKQREALMLTIVLTDHFTPLRLTVG